MEDGPPCGCPSLRTNRIACLAVPRRRCRCCPLAGRRAERCHASGSRADSGAAAVLRNPTQSDTTRAVEGNHSSRPTPKLSVPCARSRLGPWRLCTEGGPGRHRERHCRGFGSTQLPNSCDRDRDRPLNTAPEPARAHRRSPHKRVQTTVVVCRFQQTDCVCSGQLLTVPDGDAALAPTEEGRHCP